MPADIPALSDLLHGSWHRTYDGLMGRERVARATADIHDPEKLALEIADPAIITLVALDASGVSGVVKADRRANGELYIDRLHIAPEAFGTGLADSLVAAALTAMPDAKSLTLDVLEGNARAIAYYLKSGFEVEKQLNACNAILGVPTLLMRKTLSA